MISGGPATSRPSGDEGSVLVMALAFLSLFGLALAAVLAFADTGFRTASSVHTTGEKQYTADAAVEGAINKVRGDVSVGKEGSNATCFDLPAGSVNGPAVTVTCTGRAGSGATTGGAGGGAVPPNAALTLPTSTAEGVVLSTGASPLVTGSVLTNQTRAVPSGSSLTVQGTLTCRAVTGTGTVTATTTDCPAATAPAGTDPGYAAPINQAPAVAALPICTGPTVFAPGTYRDAAALNALMNGSCPNKRWHFPPGVYYFDFNVGTAREWLVNDGTAEVVGGTLTTLAFPARCDLASAGVHFLFGGESRIAVTAGSLELCPPLPATSTSQRIAVHGASTTTPSIIPSPNPVLAASTSTNTGTAGQVAFTNPGAGAAVDGTYASVALTCNKCTGSLTVGGFPRVPDNAVITSAVMRVTHSRDQPRGDVTARLVPGDGSAATDYPLTPCVRLAPTTPCAPASETQIVFVPALLGSAARLNGLAIQYNAVDAPGLGAATFFIDGITLEIGYTIFGINQSSGCAVSVPYAPGSTTSCAVLRGTGSAGRMAVKGTVYAPLAAVDLSLTGQLQPVTQRGTISRTLQLGLTSGAGYTGPTVTLPGSGPRSVLFTAAVGGVPALRAEATIDDGLGSTPGATVTVTRWSVLR